jgi:diguanylate cyclase (GGDEF)-like protein
MVANFAIDLFPAKANRTPLSGAIEQHRTRKSGRWLPTDVPAPALYYAAFVQLIIVAAAIFALSTEHGPNTKQYIVAALLFAAAATHLLVMRLAERLRDKAADGPHTTLTSVWTYAGVLLLPITLALLLVVLTRLLIYPRSRHARCRFMFCSTAVLAASLTSGTVLDILGRSVPVIILATVVYGVTQLVVSGIATRLAYPDSPLRAIMEGGREIEAMALVTATGLAAALRSQTSDPRLDTGSVILVLVELVMVASVVALANHRVDLLRARQAGLRAMNERLLATIAEQDQRHGVLAAEAAVDHKTGLLNDRGWLRQARAAVRQCRDAHVDAAVLMVDIDHFKQVNDTWGHAAGDQVLKSVAGVLRNRIRATDIVGRCGGEEFVVLLPGAGYATAVTRAEQLRAAIAEMIVMPNGKRRLPAVIVGRTVSIGVAVLSGSDIADDRTPAELLDSTTGRADEAMYIAKATGRNRVCRADGVTVSANPSAMA